MDEIDDLLKPSPVPPARNDDAVWQRTRGVLRRRRWTRRGAAVAVMVACFFAGAWAFRFAQAPPLTTELAQNDKPNMRPAVAKKTVDPFQNAAPEKIEDWAKISSGDRQIELFRRAGDSYLINGDQLAALRCYGRALNIGGPTELAVRAEDTWLMTSLKLARQKEQKNAIPEVDGGAGSGRGIDRTGSKSA
jgi:hypothetical protein